MISLYPKRALRARSRGLAATFGTALLALLVGLGGALAPTPAAAVVPSGFTSSPALTGLSQPMAIEFLPDGRALVAQRFGRIFVTDITSANPTNSMTFLNIGDLLTGGERGVLGLAADPDFENNGHIYVYYTKASTNRARVSRFTSSNDVATIASEFLIWEDNVEALNEYHYGGGLDFGPDGRLYLTIGDKFDNPAEAQDLSLSAGKILRMNADGTPPTDNPFFGQTGVIDEIWALGLRNPFRSGWDISSGRYFIGEVGGNRDNEPNISYEDVQLGVGGANYGWPNCEGPDLPNRDACNPPESRPATYEPPIYSYSHAGANKAIIGGEVYNAEQFPTQYHGAYFFGDFAEGEISYLTFDQNGDVIGATLFEDEATRVVDIAVGPDGSLYYLSLSPGAIHRISSNGAPTIDSVDATPQAGANPLTVTFTGQASSPFGTSLSYTWDFGDGQQGTGQTTSHTYQDSGSYNAILTVSDGQSAVNSLPITISVGSPPTATIESSLDGDLFKAGDVISFTGTGTDPDEQLNGSNFEWVVNFFHNEHLHPYLSPESGDGGSFTIYTTGHDFHGDTGFEIQLTVTDSTGLSDTEVLRVYPDKVNLTVDTQPSGGVIRVDSLPLNTPAQYDTANGFQHVIDAPESYCDGTNMWVFSSWSDGGARQHVVTLGDSDLDLTAAYVIDGDCSLPAGAVLVLEGDAGLSANASGKLISWADQSGQGNDLAAVSGAPQLGTTPAGLPAADFDGVGDRIRRVGGLSALPTGNADRTVIALVDHREAGWGGFGWGRRGNNLTFGVGVSNLGNYAIEGYASANNFDSGIAGVDQGWVVQSAVLSGGSLSHFIDGSLIDSQSHTFKTASTYIVLGSQIDGTPQLDMSAAAIYVYPRSLTSAERDQVESYLTNKYLGESTDIQGPVIEANQVFTVAQDTSAGTEIGTVLASDNTAVTGYAITAGDPDGALSISDAGVLTVADAALVAATSQFTLVVRASDADQNTGSAIVLVDVLEPADTTPPTIPSNQVLSTDNAASAGDVAGTVIATDNKAIAGLTIIGGNAGEAFSIDADGVLRVANAAALLSIAQFTLDVEAVDSTGNTAVGSVVVNVADVVDPVIGAGQSFVVLDNAQTGDEVGLVAASDERMIAAFNIAAGDPSGTFTIDAFGAITVVDPAALAVTTQFVLDIEVVDDSGNTSTAPITIDVEQPDQEDPVVAPGQVFQATTEAENGDVLGVVAASDDQQVTGFAITDGDPGGVFAIDPDGELSVADAAALDEAVQFLLTVEAVDAAGNSGTGQITVDIADATAPTIVPGQMFAISDDAESGDVVGTVAASDNRAITGAAITAGDPGAVFAIDPAGQLTIVNPSGLAGASQFVLTIEVVDAAGNIGTGTVTISVSDTTDPVVATGQTFSATTAMQTADVVGTVAASDDRAVVGFSILDGNPDGAFVIDEVGVLSVGDAAALAGAVQFTLTIEAVDAAGNAGSGVVTVDVADGLDPVVDPGQLFTVTSSAVNGDVIGTVATSDDRGVTGLTITGGDPGGVFAIDSGGVLSVADSTGLTSAIQFILTIEAVDAAGNIGSGQVTVGIADLESPVVTPGQTFSISTGAVDGAVVGIVDATDDRAVVGFSIAGGDPDGVFAIDSAGSLSVVDAAGLAGSAQFVLTVEATDAAGNSGSGTVVVDVADGLDPVVAVGQSFTITDAASNGDVLGTVAASDDRGVTGFDITGGDPGGVFAIDSAGVLTVADAAGLLESVEFVLTIQAVDAAGNSGTGQVTVGIADLEDPVVPPGQTFSVANDAGNADVVGTVLATDNRSVVGFSLTGGDPNGVFTVDAAGVLSVADADGLVGQPQFVLTVEAVDAAGNVGTGTVVVDVSDLLDPVVDAGQAFTVTDAASNGDVLGTVAASDDRGVTGFSITAGDPGGVFAIDAGGVLSVADSTGLTGVPEFVLTIEAVDAAGNVGTGQITVGIADLEDPVVSSGQTFSVANNAANAAVVGTVIATDNRAVVGYAVTAGDPDGVFTIDTTGALSVADSAGLAGAAQFTLTIEASDAAGNTGDAPVIVNVADATAPVIAPGQSFQVEPDAVAGSVVGSVAAVDEVGVVSLAITDGDPDGVFAIAANGELTIVNASGLAGTVQFTLTVEASDAAGNVGTGVVTIDVTQAPLLPAGAVLLLESDLGVTVSGAGIVTSWADQSGEGNDLTVRTGNPTVGTTPSGVPAIDFDGVADRLRRVRGLNGMPTGNADRTVFVVASHRESAWGGFGWGIRGNNRTFGVGVSNLGNFAIEGYTTAQNHDSGVAAVDQGWFVQSAVHDDGQMTHFLDGTLIDSQAHTYNTASTYIVLGAQIDGTPQLDMSAGAVIVYDRALTDAERLQVESYLAAKYL